MLMVVACSQEDEKIHKAKFGKLEQSAAEVKSSLGTDVSYKKFGELLNKLADEIGAAQSVVKTRREKDLLQAYSDLLSFYRDGHLLWKYRLEFAPFDFVPKERIYVGQDVEPIVAKYNLVTETHLYKPTNQNWKSISADSIRIIWRNADSQFGVIRNITEYH